MSKIHWPIVVAACLWVLVLGVVAAPLEKLTPDSSAYLDIARNVARGEGLTLKLNIYQDWLGLRHQAVTYQQPMLPLVFSTVAATARPICAANLINTLFALLTVLVAFFLFRKFVDDWQAALAICPLATSYQFYEVYSKPMAEPASMLLITVAFLFGRRQKTTGLPVDE